MSVKLKSAEKALRAIAAQNGISVEEVKEEISIAIKMGMASSDPAVQRVWYSIPRKDVVPTPEEVILWASSQARNAKLHILS